MQTQEKKEASLALRKPSWNAINMNLKWFGTRWRSNACYFPTLSQCYDICSNSSPASQSILCTRYIFHWMHGEVVLRKRSTCFRVPFFVSWKKCVCESEREIKNRSISQIRLHEVDYDNDQQRKDKRLSEANVTPYKSLTSTSQYTVSRVEYGPHICATVRKPKNILRFLLKQYSLFQVVMPLLCVYLASSCDECGQNVILKNRSSLFVFGIWFLNFHCRSESNIRINRLWLCIRCAAKRPKRRQYKANKYQKTEDWHFKRANRSVNMSHFTK